MHTRKQGLFYNSYGPSCFVRQPKLSFLSYWWGNWGLRIQTLKCRRVLRHSVVSESLWPHGLWPTRLLSPRDFSGKNTGGGSHSRIPWEDLRDGTQVFLCLRHWQVDPLPLVQPGKEKANLYTCTKHGSYEGPSDCLVSLRWLWLEALVAGRYHWFWA